MTGHGISGPVARSAASKSTACAGDILANEYTAARGRNERALIVGQTWNEVDAVNDAVRAALREAGRLGDGTEIIAYRAVDLTAAQKRDAASYGPESRVFFLKRYGRHLLVSRAG